MTYTKKQKALGLLLTGLMLLTLLGWAPLSEASTVVEVATVDELVAAIGPGADIVLLPGEYELAAAATYGKDTGNPCCCWESSSEGGYELYISNVDGLTLRGAGRDKTTLLAEDRYANVLTFTGCTNLTVSSFTAGHSPAPGYCSGGVLHLVNCTDATVELCALFGCGSMGVWAMNCNNVTVTRSRIYECSDTAVYVDGCRNVLVEDCEIDHNGWNTEYIASCLFRANGGDGFTATNCRIHDNAAELLLQCGHTRDAAFLSNQVEYNTLLSAFSLLGIPATVSECTFHGNYLGSWYAEGDESPALAALDKEGKALDEDALAAMDVRPIQLNGTEEIVLQEPLDVAPGGEVAVTTVDEFLAAIGPDRTILMDGESFSLADAAGYGTADGWYYHWEETYDGPQLVIYGVSNLTIRAAKAEGATLTAAPRYANVIAFESCDGIGLANLTLGHSEGMGECSGGVVDLSNCNDVSLKGCRLYGCGTLGVNAWTCRALNLTDCEIYDCSQGGVVLSDVRGASFQNCRIHDVPSPAISLYACDGVFWNGETVRGEHFDVTEAGELQPVVRG